MAIQEPGSLVFSLVAEASNGPLHLLTSNPAQECSKGGAGISPGGVWGVPKYPFSFFAAAGGEKKGGGSFASLHVYGCPQIIIMQMDMILLVAQPVPGGGQQGTVQRLDDPFNAKRGGKKLLYFFGGEMVVIPSVG